MFAIESSKPEAAAPACLSYGQLDGDDVRRLRELEEENRRLKKLVADQALDIQILNEVNKGKW